jgi:hypothetical protein
MLHSPSSTSSQKNYHNTKSAERGSAPATRAYNTRSVSRMLLVPKLGVNKWRLIIDLRELNNYCSEFSISSETLKHMRHLF